VTLHAIAGILALNLAFLVVGVLLLWATCGIPTWRRLAELSGVAYFVGLSVSGVLLTLLLVVGIHLPGWAMAVSVVVVALAALAAGRVRSSPLPRGRPALPRLAAIDVVGFAAVAIVLEALFRAGRLAGLYTWDAWAFWVPKAKAIYYFGDLDHSLFSSLPGPTYPPLLPALEAADFHAMGGVDVVTLHLQFWVLGVAFAAAVMGLLWTRVPRVLLWPMLALALAAPRVGEYVLEPQADFLLDFLFVVAALLVALWLLDGARWHVLTAIPLLTACVLTKREGVLFVACLAVAAAAASVGRLRRSWRLLALCAGVPALATVAWHAWYTSHGIGGEVAPGAGFASGLDLDRARRSLGLSLRALVDTGRWSIVPWLGLVALAGAIVAGRSRAARFYGCLVVFLVLGGAWITWSFRELQITTNGALNPIIRYTAAIELLLATAVPLLVTSVPAHRLLERLQIAVRPVAAAAIAALAVFAYPVAAIARGLPRFPSPHECMRQPAAGQPASVVFGRFETLAGAQQMLAHVSAVGFQNVDIDPDGCGRLVVWLPNVDSVATAAAVVAEARTAHLAAHVEAARG
jgi:hypothetical protein